MENTPVTNTPVAKKKNDNETQILKKILNKDGVWNKIKSYFKYFIFLFILFLLMILLILILIVVILCRVNCLHHHPVHLSV